MKTQILNLVIATGFAAMIANTPALAENNHTATIPFAFTAGATEYPSGVYEVSTLGSGLVVKLTNVETGRARVASVPIPIDNVPAASPKLVFKVTADGYKLSEVWLQGAPGRKTYGSPKDSEAASVKIAIR